MTQVGPIRVKLQFNFYGEEEKGPVLSWGVWYADVCLGIATGM